MLAFHQIVSFLLIFAFVVFTPLIILVLDSPKPVFPPTRIFALSSVLFAPQLSQSIFFCTVVFPPALFFRPLLTFYGLGFCKVGQAVSALFLPPPPLLSFSPVSSHDLARKPTFVFTNMFEFHGPVPDLGFCLPSLYVPCP